MILIAIGANLSTSTDRSPQSTCEWAIERMRQIPGLTLDSFSPWYLSEPIPKAAQPPYVNGMARFSGAADPAWLLNRLHEIEAETGRARRESQINDLNAPRTLDLDLIDLNGLINSGPSPVLPHPRAHLRAFVLVPLHDVAPDWLHPISGKTAAALVAALPPQQIAPLAPAGRIA